ncbi:MAG TPA: hypothetical protein VGV18_02375 [Verrucomicrobiae bacterium]|nr:hypothetical protein [Verrucomicrobiae bacterium]
MFGKQMMALQARKKALLLESDLNRLRLRAELNHLREMTSIANPRAHLGRFGGWASTLGPVVGTILALAVGRTALAGGLVRKALAAAPALIRLWRLVSSLRAEFR